VNPFNALAEHRRFRFLPAFAILAAVILMAAPNANAKKIKIATMAPKGSIFYTVLKDLADEWKTISKGKLKLKIYPGGIAGGDREVIRKIKLGTLHGGLITSAGLASLDKSINAMQIPLAFRDHAEADYVLAKLRPSLEATYAAKGIIVLGWAEAGWIRFLSKSPLLHPDDRKNHKFFVFTGDPEQADVWKAAGFKAVPLPTAEISTALQTGLISALPTTAQAASLLQWYTHAPHMMNRVWAPMLGALVMGKSVWEDKVDKSLHDALRAATERAAARLLVEGRKAERMSVAAMEKRGLVVHTLTDAQTAAWSALVESARDAIRGPFAAPDKYDAVMQHIATYRSTQAK